MIQVIIKCDTCHQRLIVESPILQNRWPDNNQATILLWEELSPAYVLLKCPPSPLCVALIEAPCVVLWCEPQSQTIYLTLKMNNLTEINTGDAVATFSFRASAVATNRMEMLKAPPDLAQNVPIFRFNSVTVD